MTKFHLMIGVIILNISGLYAHAKTLLVLGDSLSAAYQMEEKEGWVALLENKLNQTYKDWQVINASIAGDTTNNALQRLPFLLKNHQPHAVIIEIGANDGLQAKPFPYIKQNIADMITKIQAQKAEVFLIQAPLTSNFDLKYSELFAKIYQDLEQQYQLTLIPFSDPKYIGNKEYIQNDGLHPNAKAQPLIMENVWGKMASYFSKSATK